MPIVVIAKNNLLNIFKFLNKLVRLILRILYKYKTIVYLNIYVLDVRKREYMYFSKQSSVKSLSLKIIIINKNKWRE